MKTLLIKLFFLTIVSILTISCVEIMDRRYFDVKNNTSKLIYWSTSYSYPNTSLKSIENVPSKNTAYKVYPGKIESFTMGIFSYNPTAQVFIFDADVIENIPWDTIVKYNMFLKRYQFTESELKKMNYELIYDGN